MLMSSDGYAQSINSFFQIIGNQGTFAVGVLFGTLLGCLVSWGMHWLAAKNNNRRLKIDLEREKELRDQLNMKDERINKLHDQVGALQQSLAEARGGKKK